MNMKFKQILEILLENTNADILKVAIKDDGVIHKGSLYDTHYNILDRYKCSDSKVMGFISSTGKFLNRTQALEWIKTYTPLIYRQYIKIVKKAKLQHPEFGYETELESTGYRKALGIE